MSVYYSEDHEWIRVEGDTATIGITNHAAEQLGDVVFIDLQEAGTEFEASDEIGVIESVKAASEIYAPLSGEIIEANAILEDEPGKINESAESEAWIYKVKLANSDELEKLMDAEAYKALIA
ncbi:MAG: glycine cleavage system protein GcvH [Cohaesibacter sp.]|jgi:glycine cleavage system H protein|nr:glycine cleavage system protein GcvH [Cohaesibacter sp.]